MSEKNCNLCYVRQITTPIRSPKSVYDLPSYDNGVTKPPMGWSSWNCFRNNIDENKIISIGEALIKTGLKDKGFVNLNLDDNWHSSMRDENGELQGDLERFPNGIPNLIAYLNSKGLKVGLYTSNGTLTCEDLPGSFGNEERDSYTFAKWGAEFFKYDFCHHKPFTPIAPLVAAVGLINKDNKKDQITLTVDQAVLGGNAKLVKDVRMPGGYHVKGLNKNKGIVIFESVKASEGEYVMTITTRKRGKQYDKFLAVEVNNDVQIVTIPGCAKFNHTARVQCNVKLTEGDNIIKLYNPITSVTDGYVIQYRTMGKLLKQATERVAKETQKEEKPITYSICEWGRNRPWQWGRTAGNQWRTTPDIRPWWLWMMMIYDFTVKLYKYSEKGHYNDPDMLEVGNGKLTYDQNKSHFNLWCMMNAPLILGNDLRKFIKEDGTVDNDNVVLKIVTNEKMIAINQDDEGKACKRVKHGCHVDVLAKPLAKGTAVCIFNRSPFKKKVKYDLRKLIGDEYVLFSDKDEYSVEDCWSDDKFVTRGELSVDLPPYGSVVYVIK